MPRKILLIVEDEGLVRRTLARLMKRHFDEVVTAETPDKADELLRQHAVTHLVSDCRLGPDLPPGCELIPTWRKSHPSITRAVVYSGSRLAKDTMPAEVDAVVPKIDGFDPLLEALELEQ